jgi:hypothetical protein
MFRRAMTVALAVALCGTTAARAQTVKDEYADLETKELIAGPAIGSASISGPTTFSSGASLPSVRGGFQGLSQYDVASFARNFIPPDTMGAAGKTQLMEFVNGGVAVFDKSTGATLSKVSDLAFWAAAGRTGANGDSRVMYDKQADRWIALSFASSVSQIQIAVSDTSDALGGWKSTAFTGFAGGTADYPTLALDGNNAYIGTNNFNAAGNFRGTSLNVIPLSSLLSAGGPNLTGAAALVTPYSPVTGGADRGFAIQGVNNLDLSDPDGHIIAASLFFNDNIRYDIVGAGNLSTASVTPVTYLGPQDYAANDAGRQPNAVPDICVTPGGCSFPSNDRVIDTLDQRIGSSVYEVNGRIYSVYTATNLGGDTTYVRYLVVDAATNAILDQGQIGDGVHDYYEGSLAVNRFGQVVIAYNRSGSGADGKIDVMARTFSTGANGKLTQRGDEMTLMESIVDDYHNGSLDGQIANGRQRWGDYSAVSLDPTDDRNFWIFGEYAREYNDEASGHPGGTGGSRWSTWVGSINSGTSVPEPGTWTMMIGGLALAGAALRRRRAFAQA